MKFWTVGLIFLVQVLLSACATGQLAETYVPSEPIVLDVRKTSAPNSLACEVEVFATYPSDMQPQTRDLVISDTSSELIRSFATVQLPRPPDDPRPLASDNGTTSFQMFQWSFSPCREVPLSIQIGDCKEGTCPLMQVSPEIPEGVTVQVDDISATK